MAGSRSEYQPVTIGELRDRVVFAKSSNVIDPVTGRSEQTLSSTDPDYACIRPIGTQQFYDGYNTESEITHTVYVRYRSDAHMYDRILQTIILETDRPQTREYQIVRTTEYNGLRVFSRLDVKLLQKLPA